MSRPEGKIEDYLRGEVKKRGGIAAKFAAPGYRSWPDRLVLFPEGKAYFVELKAPGKKPTAQQELRHNQLNDIGFPVSVIDTKAGVDDWLKRVLDKNV